MYKLDLYKTKYMVMARNDYKLIFNRCNRMQAYDRQRISTAAIISCDTKKIDYYRDSVTGYSINNIRTPLA